MGALDERCSAMVESELACATVSWLVEDSAETARSCLERYVKKRKADVSLLETREDVENTGGAIRRRTVSLCYGGGGGLPYAVVVAPKDGALAVFNSADDVQAAELMTGTGI
jgi:hypothetical protein